MPQVNYGNRHIVKALVSEQTEQTLLWVAFGIFIATIVLTIVFFTTDNNCMKTFCPYYEDDWGLMICNMCPVT